MSRVQGAVSLELWMKTKHSIYEKYIWVILSDELKKNLEALQEINDRDLFKGLGVCELGIQAKTQKCSKKNNSYNKQCILENDQSCVLSPSIGPGQLSVRCQAGMVDARWSRRHVSGSLVTSWWSG